MKTKLITFTTRKIRMKKITLLIALFITITHNTNAQSFNTVFLFGPGLTTGVDYVPNSSINDSTDFQFTKYKVQYVHPLKTKIGVKGLNLKDFNFKNLDAKASQIFFNTRFNIIQPTLIENNFYENIYSGTVGITALTASIKNGVWLYSANIYFSENETTITKSPMPNFLGYIANVRVKSLEFMYFYGASLAVNQGKIVPIPIFGFTAKIASKLNVTLLFPVQAKITYKATKTIKLELATNYDVLNTIHRSGSSFQNNNNSINYSQLKTYVGLNTKLNSNFELLFEGGYSAFKKINTIHSDFSQNVAASWYGSFSVRYRFGKSVFENFLNK